MLIDEIMELIKKESENAKNDTLREINIQFGEAKEALNTVENRLWELNENIHNVADKLSEVRSVLFNTEKVFKEMKPFNFKV